MELAQKHIYRLSPITHLSHQYSEVPSYKKQPYKTTHMSKYSNVGKHIQLKKQANINRIQSCNLVAMVSFYKNQ